MSKFLLALLKVKRYQRLPFRYLRKGFLMGLIFVLVSGWIFSGWPQIWQNPQIPPKIQEARADTVTFVGKDTTTTTEDATSISLSMPAGSVGDLLVAILWHDDHGDGPFSTMPPGETWYLIDLFPSVGGDNSRGYVYWSIATSADASSHSFSGLGGIEEIIGHARRYSGHDSSTPFQVVDAAARFKLTEHAKGLTTLDAPSVSADRDNSMLLCIWGADDDDLIDSGSTAFPAGMVQTILGPDFDNNCGMASAEQSVNSGATGAKTYSVGQATPTITNAVSLIIQPPAGGLSTSIKIRNVANTHDVSSITFPVGDISAVISNPTGYGGDTQILTDTAGDATPVAILTSTTAYTLWFNVTDSSGWGDTVANEKIYTQGIGVELNLTGFDAVDKEITVWGTDQTATPQALAADVSKELFLQITLSSNYGKTGESIFSVLGEL